MISVLEPEDVAEVMTMLAHPGFDRITRVTLIVACTDVRHDLGGAYYMEMEPMRQIISAALPDIRRQRCHRRDAFEKRVARCLAPKLPTHMHGIRSRLVDYLCPAVQPIHIQPRVYDKYMWKQVGIDAGWR